ncbi:MAG: signal peptidase I [Candidatus Pacebacteria bacterium]|nr:signal peptidase I [Candidatus Paceibacterota bacterium]
MINNNNIEDSNDNKSELGFFSEVKSFSFETIKIVIFSLIIIVGIRSFVMQPFFVSGQSMEPNFHDGDYLIVDEISYRLGDPERGDAIIFHYPNDTRLFYIKRIIGLPGEKIEIKDNVITIYNAENPGGMKLDENFYIPSEKVIIGNYIKELKNDEYYVLGDNRVASADSRVWGVLKKNFIVGKAWMRPWPLDNISVFEKIGY